MIAHQHISVDLPAGFSACLRQARHKHVSILVVAINGFLMIPSAHDACLAQPQCEGGPVAPKRTAKADDKPFPDIQYAICELHADLTKAPYLGKPDRQIRI